MTLWQQRKSLLKSRKFLLFLLHSYMTVAGGAMGYIALTWYVVNLNHHAFFSGMLVSLSFWLPSVCLGPFAGVLVDRYPRKNVLVVTNIIRLSAMAILGLALYFWPALWICCVLSLINGLTFAVINPAVMAFVRELVPNEKLLAANSTIDVCIELSNVLGMAVAGILIVFVSITTTLMLIATCIGVGLIFLCCLHQRADEQHHLKSLSSPWEELVEGLQYLLRRPFLMTLYALGTVLFIQFMISPVLLAPYIKTVIHGSGFDFSLIELSLSLGVIAGSLIIPQCSERFGRVACLAWSVVWLSVLFFLISLSRSVNVLVVLYGLLGVGLPLWTVIASYAQENTEKSMQGRVQSVANTLSSLCLLVVYILLSLNHSHMILAHTYWFCSLLGVLAIGLLRLLRHFEYQLAA